MNSRERLLGAIRQEELDHVPLYCWCFGFTAPSHLRWRRNGRGVAHWYTMRLEFIHTLPEPWALEDDFERVLRWFNLGMDDMLEVSLPPGIHQEVRIRDWREPPARTEPHWLLCREYETPAGPLRHVVRRTDEKFGPGWVVQPDHVALVEDMNIPRGVKHLVTGPEDLPKLRYILKEPSADQLNAYRERVKLVRCFAQKHGVFVQGWGPLGLDGTVYFCGVDGAVTAAMTQPDFFQELLDIIDDFDRRVTAMMLDVGGIDLLVQRGWFSATDFWSPTLFRQFVSPRLKHLARMVHQSGSLFGYTMTCGAPAMAEDLIGAGVDLLYYVDPLQDRTDLAEVKRRFQGRLAAVGGVDSAVTLLRGSEAEIRQTVQTVVRTLGPTGFILAPVDALFPDTPWSSVQAMIEAWREVRDGRSLPVADPSSRSSRSAHRQPPHTPA
jgi:hypothetical protein